MVHGQAAYLQAYLQVSHLPDNHGAWIAPLAISVNSQIHVGFSFFCENRYVRYHLLIKNTCLDCTIMCARSQTLVTLPRKL